MSVSRKENPFVFIGSRLTACENYDLIALGQGPRSVLIQWLQRRDLLANPLNCAPCNQGMELIQRNDTHVDGFQW